MTYRIIRQSDIDRLSSEIRDLRDVLGVSLTTKIDNNDGHWHEFYVAHLNSLEEIHLSMTGDIKPVELKCSVDSIVMSMKHKLIEPDMNTIDGLNDVYLHIEIPTNRIRRITVSGNEAPDEDKGNILRTICSIGNILNSVKIELPEPTK